MTGQKETETERKTEIPIPDKEQVDHIKQVLRESIPEYHKWGIVHIKVENGKIVVDVNHNYVFDNDLYAIIYFTDVDHRKTKRMIFYEIVDADSYYKLQAFHGFHDIMERNMERLRQYANEHINSDNPYARKAARKDLVLVTVYEILHDTLREYLRRYYGIRVA